MLGFTKMTKRARNIQGYIDRMTHGHKDWVTLSIDRFEDTRFPVNEIFKDELLSRIFVENEIEGLFFYNLNLYFDAGFEDTVVFTAHHDINNPTSDNCQDNSASVINLLELANRIIESGKDSLTSNVLISFTDAEEFGGKGAARLGDQINEGVYGNVKYCVNSELTALGGSLWMESGLNGHETIKSKLEDLDLEIEYKHTPFNDSVILRYKGIESICFGILPENEIESSFPKTWALCHREDDKSEVGMYNLKDMSNYVDFLEKMI